MSLYETEMRRLKRMERQFNEALALADYLQQSSNPTDALCQMESCAILMIEMTLLRAKIAAIEDRRPLGEFRVLISEVLLGWLGGDLTQPPLSGQKFAIYTDHRLPLLCAVQRIPLEPSANSV